jgi:hypothetical protein
MAAIKAHGNLHTNITVQDRVKTIGRSIMAASKAPSNLHTNITVHRVKNIGHSRMAGNKAPSNLHTNISVQDRVKTIGRSIMSARRSSQQPRRKYYG